MLNFSKWKLISIIIIILVSIYFFIPTFFYNVNLPSFFSEQKINFGLDLKGGASLTIETDIDDYIEERFAIVTGSLKDTLIKEKIQFKDWRQDRRELNFSLEEVESSTKNAIKKINQFVKSNELNIKNSGADFYVVFNNAHIDKMKSDAIRQSMEIITKRIDAIGTKEVEIQTVGDDMILLQVPGLDDPKEIKKIIGKTARLTFHLVKAGISDNLSEAEKIKLIINSKILPFENGKGMLVVENIPVMTGDMLSSVSVGHGAMGEPTINFRLGNLGREIFADITTKNHGKMLAIVLDNKILSSPVIREPILSGDGVISGNFTPESATELALLLKAGALPVPLKIVEERAIEPSLGFESIKAGVKACIVAAIAVLIIMVVYYRFFGLVANFALLINFVMIISVLAIFGATLTLPGIAGIVLTLGMAVDANVLIFERVKEELKKGRTVLTALHNGYKFAFSTIFDSNITTIVAALVLYIFGSGPIKGFAVTLNIGILCSMFTSVTVTKMLITIWYRIKNPKTLKI